MGQSVLSLIQICLKWSKQRKNTACDENREKRLELFMETCTKYLKGLYDLKRLVSGYEIIKSFEKYKAVRTRFTFDIFFFLKDQYGSNHIVENRVNAEFQTTLWFNYGQYGSQCSATVFKWTIRFNRTVRVGTLYLIPW